MWPLWTFRTGIRSVRVDGSGRFNLTDVWATGVEGEVVWRN
jgi:hypothetical protein